MAEALVLEERGKLSLRDFPLQQDLGPADVRVSVRTVGVCGSDVHYYTHGKIGPFVVEEPMILGHEAAGVVIETGADVVPMEAAKAAEKTVEKAADAGLATVAKIKSDAKEAAAAAREATDTAVKEAEKTAETLTTALEPEDFRRPAEIAKPDTPDDLKLISGVGPKLEQVLNGLGVWTFDQVSKWTAEEIAWVDDYLQFKGRIERDDWIRQAAALAEGAAKK